MNTEIKKIEISIKEVAAYLGWKYSRAQSVKFRQEPSEDYEEYLKAVEKIRVAKIEAQKTFEKFLKS
ncbi:hypothetical protein SDC9_00410 [bioreactor metagenome]|uniref:Uncharacterized protein n=1 Tax=bioreactor metagenome TaxID=1076179 RepID=A0A644SJR9_9ZZZZ